MPCTSSADVEVPCSENSVGPFDAMQATVIGPPNFSSPGFDNFVLGSLSGNPVDVSTWTSTVTSSGAQTIAQGPTVDTVGFTLDFTSAPTGVFSFDFFAYYHGSPVDSAILSFSGTGDPADRHQ